ncbi:unnamed protein product, partial [Phaeothamnion confervicola]
PGGKSGGPNEPGPRPGGPSGPPGPRGPMGGPFGGPGMPGAPEHHDSESDHSRAVVVVIPLENELVNSKLDPTKVMHPQNNPEYRKFVAQYYGRKLQASLYIDTSSIQLYDNLIGQPGPLKTRYTELRDKYKAWALKKAEPQLLYDALILALESGVIRDTVVRKDNAPPCDATTIAQELLDVAAENKLPLTTDAKRFVAAWQQMSKAVRAPAPQASNAESWRVKLNASHVLVEGHYAIVYWDSLAPEVYRRATQLNDNFAAFFLCHATRGVVVPVPEKPLVVVLARDAGEQMHQLRLGLDGLPSPVDAFYAPDHNITVLAPQRMDGVGRAFFRQTNQHFVTGFNREELLSGKIPKLDHGDGKGSKPDDVARATTLAVVEKLVADESEIAAVSREATTQLLYTTQMLPRFVTLPNWLTQGAANCYMRPR